MFKLIFKTIGAVVLLAILIVALAVWKGGEPFRWIGEEVKTVGKAIEEFGEVVDVLTERKDEVQKTFKGFRKTITSVEKKVKRQQSSGEENGAVNKDKESE